MPKVAPVTVLMVSYMLARPPFRFVRFENKHLDLMWLDRVGSGWTGLDRWIFFAANFKNGLRFACAFCISGMGLSHTRGLGW